MGQYECVIDSDTQLVDSHATLDLQCRVRNVYNFKLTALSADSLLRMIFIYRFKSLMAERQGFEPWVPFNRYDSLANCSFRPLRHRSVLV